MKAGAREVFGGRGEKQKGVVDICFLFSDFQHLSLSSLPSSLSISLIYQFPSRRLSDQGGGAPEPLLVFYFFASSFSPCSDLFSLLLFSYFFFMFVFFLT
jgi:hypothetical protein